MDEEEYLLGQEERLDEEESADEEDWSGDSSQYSSYYSDSDDSSIPEWESYVEENGQLLYIDCHPFVKQLKEPTEVEGKSAAVQITKNRMRKSTRSKFLRLIRRRDSKRRSSKRFVKSSDAQVESKVTFHDSNEGEVKIVVLAINSESKGRRSKLAENLLGLSVSTFPDGNRIMVAGITPNGNTKTIKIGDWLKTINGINVNSVNFQSMLDTLDGQSEVTLELQRVTGVEVTKEPPSNELSTQSPFVKQLTNVCSNENLQLLLIEQPVGILYLDLEKLTESAPEFQEVVYCYPKPVERNKLCLARGMFITLNQLLKDLTNQRPEITSVLLGERLAHVAYSFFDSKLILLMVPDNRVKSDEIAHLMAEVLRTLKFIHRSLQHCFEAEPNGVEAVETDHFFSRFFARVLAGGGQDEQGIVLSSLASRALAEAAHQFESLQPTAHFLPLPNEAQMQIDDALSELEACDYREWNDDPLDCQRLFTILGSAVYHSGYLLASHFIHQDLIDVHLYCRQQGLFRLSQVEPVKSLVLWREVYPYSCNREKDSKFVIPDDSRHYLLIVGSGKDLLAVIMEAGGCTEPPEDNLAPDAFYVEEAQATLAHLQELGIPELAQRWLRTNPGTQVTIPQLTPNKRMSDFLGNINFPKPLLKENTSPNNNSSINLINSKKDLTSILKRRNSDQGASNQSAQSPSVFSIPDEVEVSEDSVSQSNYSHSSEMSDEPVLGRRAQRERLGKDQGSDDDESDIDDYRDGSQLSVNSYDLSELRNTLLNETGDAQPMPLTVGKELVLYHYVQLDFTEGLLISPPDCTMESKTLDLILSNFRKTCHHMHRIFQNSIRFKSMTSEEMTKSALNKSMVAVKECGMLFEVPFVDELNKKHSTITYWVTGRLFHLPHPKEIYVCYKDSIIQNLVEIAFKLAISTVA